MPAYTMPSVPIPAPGRKIFTACGYDARENQQWFHAQCALATSTLDADHPHASFIAGRGAGKTRALVMQLGLDLIENTGRRGVYITDTFDITDYVFNQARDWLHPYIANIRRSEREIQFYSGSWLNFTYGNCVDHLRGRVLNYAGIDHALMNVEFPALDVLAALHRALRAAPAAIYEVSC